MEETQVAIFPIFPHIIERRFAGSRLQFLEDYFIYTDLDTRREIVYKAITWVELKSLFAQAHHNPFASLDIWDSHKGYHGLGKSMALTLSWGMYTTQQQAEIIKILGTQAPQAQYNDLALEAFRHWL